MSRLRKNEIGGPIANAVVLLFLGLWAVVLMYPVFWLFMSSFKPSALVRARIFDLPKSFYLNNYDFAKFDAQGITLLLYLGNSTLVTAVSLSILMVVSTLAGYGIGKLRVPGKNALVIVLLSLIGIPVHALMVPIFYFFAGLGMINNYRGLILPYVAFSVPFSTVVLQTYFRQFPNELIDAAKIDGCTTMGGFLQVVLPISLGSVSSVLVVNFLGIWNEFMFSLVMMRANDSKTLPVGLMGFKGRYQVDWGPMMAALVIAIIPSLIFYAVFNRNLLKGISAGAIKG